MITRNRTLAAGVLVTLALAAAMGGSKKDEDTTVAQEPKLEDLARISSGCS
ncbi:hypothetical protein HOB85_06855, partial [Candidatus Woesearchaeota archaeon]|nr:hypothetical protein [Candidatus Woesearchaeota archaeon]